MCGCDIKIVTFTNFQPFFHVLHAFRDAAAKESINVINFDWHDQVRFR
jgi:hypothetical protein